MSAEATPEAVALAMIERFRQRNRLDHRVAVQLIRKLSAEMYLYTNRNGNDAIKVAVLDAFRALTEAGDDDIVWSKHGHYWRRRKDGDLPGVREVS